MSNIATALALTGVQHEVPEPLSKSQVASHREVQRAQVLLMASEGLANEWISRVVGMAPGTVRSQRSRFAEDGLKSLDRCAKDAGAKR